MSLLSEKISTSQAGSLDQVTVPDRTADWQTVIQQVWDSYGVRPYPRGWMSPADPEAATRMAAIVNLHCAAASNSTVYYVDEKPITGTLGGGCRTARSSGRWRHRIGVLFAALDPVGGKIIARYMRRQRSNDFIRFLNVLNRESPPDRQVHVVLDNFAPHRHATVQEWLSRHPRFKLHFTPAGMSWTNLVEILFSNLTTRYLKWRLYGSVSELRTTVVQFVAWVNGGSCFGISCNP